MLLFRVFRNNLCGKNDRNPQKVTGSRMEYPLVCLFPILTAVFFGNHFPAMDEALFFNKLGACVRL